MMGLILCSNLLSPIPGRQEPAVSLLHSQVVTRATKADPLI